MRGFFVTGTDTGVGKTQVSVALLEVLASRGLAPVASKPYESGGAGDSQALWRAAGAWQRTNDVCLYRYAKPLAPGLAAPKGRAGDPRRVLALLRRFRAHPLVVEGAGGLYVPLTPRHDVIDLAAMVRLPVVVVARAGLGTINHTTLTLKALEQRGLEVAGVVLVQAVRGKDASIPLNRPELERRFPRLPFFGPVPFIANAARRRAALREAVTPLVERHLSSQRQATEPSRGASRGPVGGQGSPRR
jgi:dethiobiotin synthetase